MICLRWTERRAGSNGGLQRGDKVSAMKRWECVQWASTFDPPTSHVPQLSIEPARAALQGVANGMSRVAIHRRGGSPERRALLSTGS